MGTRGDEWCKMGTRDGKHCRMGTRDSKQCVMVQNYYRGWQTVHNLIMGTKLQGMANSAEWVQGMANDADDKQCSIGTRDGKWCRMGTGDGKWCRISSMDGKPCMASLLLWDVLDQLVQNRHAIRHVTDHDLICLTGLAGDSATNTAILCLSCLPVFGSVSVSVCLSWFYLMKLWWENITEMHRGATWTSTLSHVRLTYNGITCLPSNHHRVYYWSLVRLVLAFAMCLWEPCLTCSIVFAWTGRGWTTCSSWLTSRSAAWRRK